MKRWVRERWWELRTGMGNYLSPASTAFNLIVVIAIYTKTSGIEFTFLAAGIIALFASIGTTIGHLHRKWQQATDTRLTNEAIVNDIVSQVVERLERKIPSRRLEN